MNAILVANWPFLLAFVGGVLLGIGVGWVLRSWRDPETRDSQKQPEAAAHAHGRTAEAGAARRSTVERRAAPAAAPSAGQRPADSGSGPTVPRVDRTHPSTASHRPAAGTDADYDDGIGVGDAPTVLLIDDRLEMLGIHTAYLRKHGYRTLLADSGATGLAFARQYHPDLIVLDHSMPDRTGVEVARDLKADPTTATIPILLMTAMSYGAVGAAAMEAGCEAYLPKPIEPSRLLREVEARTRPPKH